MQIQQNEYNINTYFQSTMSSIDQLLLLLFVVFVLYMVVYQQIIKPLKKMQFYRKQGINCQFVPFTGSSRQDSKNVILNGDYYHKWILKSKTNPPIKMFCKNIGSQCAIVLLHPKLIQQMFIDKDSFVKHEFQNALIKSLSPYGLVLLEGKMWKKHRKIISKGFDYNRIDSLLLQVNRISTDILNKINKKHEILVQNGFNFFKQIAGNIISLTYFQQDIACLQIQGKSMPVFLSDLIADLANQSYDWKYCNFGMNLVNLQIFPSHKKLLKNIQLVRETVRKVIKKHIQITKNKSSQNFSMWDCFISEDNPQLSLSEQQMIDQFITFFSDGIYTTGHFMMMLTYHLCKNPQWKQKLTQQLQHNLLNVDKPTQSLINSLPIFNACMRQTLRLVPPVVTGIQRIATRDTCLSDGTNIKKGTMIFACHLVNHLNPEFHDEPSTFNPDRWLNSQSKTLKSVKQYPGSFIPFSIGDRHCPGQKFAMAESAIFLSKFLTQMNCSIFNEQNYKMKFTQRFLRQPLDPIKFLLTAKTSTNNNNNTSQQQDNNII